MVRTCYNKSKSCVIVFFWWILSFQDFRFQDFSSRFFPATSWPKNLTVFQNTPTFRSGHIGKLQLVGETGNWSAWASHQKTSLLWWFTMEQGMGDDWIPIHIFTPSDKRTKHTDTGSWERNSNEQRCWSSCFMNIHRFHELTWFTPKYLRWFRKCSDSGEHPCSLTATTQQLLNMMPGRHSPPSVLVPLPLFRCVHLLWKILRMLIRLASFDSWLRISYSHFQVQGT